MYIVVQCGLSSIVEYGPTISVVDFVQFFCSSESVCHTFMYFRGLYISFKKKPDTRHIMYHFCSMRLGFVVSRYLLGTLGDSHYFLSRKLLPYDMNQIYIVVSL